MIDDAWNAAPVGLAVLQGDGTASELNEAARVILGDADPSMIFRPTTRDEGQNAEPIDAERTLHCVIEGEQRALAYRLSSTRRGRDRVLVVAFRDITTHLRQQRRIAAVASTAARVASERSLTVSLSVMAREIARADGMAGVQIIAVDDRHDFALKVMGAAGFPHTPHFFDLLLSCRARGASLKMMEAFKSGRPSVVPHRYAAVMDDPAWEPLWDTLRTPEWDGFASVPLLAHARPIGVLNAFFSPDQCIDNDLLLFLGTMADQAALALDYAELFEQQRVDAGRAERQKLARELHDSVVQQVFSIGMQTEALKLLAAPRDPVSWPRVSLVAQELESTTRTVLADLRNLVAQLPPAPPTHNGLCQALDDLAARTRRRTSLNVTLVRPTMLDDLGAEMAEDLYFVIAEAVHNTVKHAEATSVDVRVEHDELGASIKAVVSDDGRGLDVSTDRSERGYGFTSMRERAEHWLGHLEVRAALPAGTCVSLEIPAGPPYRRAGGEST